MSEAFEPYEILKGHSPEKAAGITVIFKTASRVFPESSPSSQSELFNLFSKLN